jgi:hypothetical protein
MGGAINAYKTVCRKPEWKRPHGRSRLSWKERLILECVLQENRVGEWGVGSSGARWKPVCGEHGNESSSSIKGDTFLDKLKDFLFPKKDFAQWSWFLFSEKGVVSENIQVIGVQAEECG